MILKSNNKTMLTINNSKVKTLLIIAILITPVFYAKAQISVDNLTINNQLGIGTSSPSSKLGITGNTPFLSIFGNNYSGIWLGNNDIGPETAFSRIVYNYNAAYGLSFFVNNDHFPALKIKHNGHVGIGTDDPQTLLSLTDGSANAIGISNNRSSGSPGGSSAMELSTADANGDQATRFLIRGGGPDKDFEFYGGNAGNEEQLMVLKGNGNLAIGAEPTNDYNSALHLQGQNEFLTMYNEGNGESGIILADADRPVISNPNDIGMPTFPNCAQITYDSEKEKLNFTVNNALGGWSALSIMTADNTPNALVTIGYQPDDKTSCTGANFDLLVNNGIKTEELICEPKSNWCDYVFDKDYHLKSIEKVDQYIAENGHLEGIPTAEEVEEKGINVGEMNTKLLKKVEELTLYTIRQEEKIDKQTKKIKKQSEKIKTLKKQKKRIDILERKIEAMQQEQD